MARGTSPDGAWITRREAARRLNVGENAVHRIADAGLVRVRVLPGTYPKYNARDIARLDDEAAVRGPVPAGMHATSGP